MLMNSKKAPKKQHPNLNLTQQWYIRTSSGDVHIDYHSLEYYAEVSKHLSKALVDKTSI